MGGPLLEEDASQLITFEGRSSLIKYNLVGLQSDDVSWTG